MCGRNPTQKLIDWEFPRQEVGKDEEKKNFRNYIWATACIQCELDWQNKDEDIALQLWEDVLKPLYNFLYEVLRIS